MRSMKLHHNHLSCSSGRAAPRLPAWKPSGRNSRQARLPNFNRLFGIVLCLRQVASSQGPPSESTRRRTAQHVLDIISNQKARDSAEDVEIRKALHQLPVTGVDKHIWRTLADAVESSGPSGLRAALGWQLFHVPNVSGALDARCQLTAYPVGRRFKPETKINTLMANVFESIHTATHNMSLPEVNLSRWDLFHAHAFRSWRDGKLGFLFHAKEYPQECEAFPYNLGFCQRGSSLEYDTRGMDFRNLLLYEDVLCGLDVGETSILHDTLIMDGLQPVRTVLESDFGQGICDVNYFHTLQDRPREERLFICGSYSDSKGQA